MAMLRKAADRGGRRRGPGVGTALLREARAHPPVGPLVLLLRHLPMLAQVLPKDGFSKPITLTVLPQALTGMLIGT